MEGQWSKSKWTKSEASRWAKNEQQPLNYNLKIKGKAANLEFMEAKALASSPMGRLITINGYDPRFQEEYSAEAFLPNPLPGSLNLNPATYQAIIRASTSLARADEAIALLPNPNLLVRPAIRREAVSTSALEGTFAAFTDVLASEFLGDDELGPSVSEVRNYVRATEEALDWIGERPFTLGLLEHLQAEIVQGTPADGTEAGHLRTTQVFIGAGNRRVSEARFVPPPPGDHLRDGVLSWLDWINDASDVPIVAKAAMAHYQFECLHPFNDGNGRLGRLVAVLQFVRSGELRAPVVNISPWLEPRREQYQHQLLQLSITGNVDEWLQFFAAGVEAQSRDAIQKVGSLRLLQQQLVERVKSSKAKGSAVDIARDLIGYPILNVGVAAELAGVSFQAANQGVARLVELGLLRQYGDGKYDRLFVCDDVLRVVER